MISIEHKTETRRTARAQAIVKVAPATILRLKRNDLPKKDVLVVARTAGMMAAKQTPSLLPDCHPLNLEMVEMKLEAGKNQVRIEARVALTGKTGAEMEALTAVTVAALTVYDMLKPIDKKMEITGVKLLEKTGGKSDKHFTLPPKFQAAVMVVSDRASKGIYKDASGTKIKDYLKSLGVKKTSYHVLEDNQNLITSLLKDLCGRGVDLILTTGGTGLSPRDVTVEAVQKLIDREIPGVAETARAYGQRRTPYAMLSRGIAGQRGKSLIVTLPGSPKAVEEWLSSLFPGLLHAFNVMNSKPGH
jgi:molybdenum cofactor biosynthesis protein MoaC